MNDRLSESHTRVVESILTRELNVRAGQLAPEARFDEDLAADSLALVEITMLLEDQLNISIPDERWDKIKTVGDLFEMLAELLQENRRQP
jgi:acyl carrier protein